MRGKNVDQGFDTDRPFIKERPIPPAEPPKPSPRRRLRRLVLLGLIFMLVIVFAYKNVKNMTQVQALKGKLSQAEQELQLDLDYQEDLEEYIRLLENEDYALNMARNEYYLTDEGEVVFNFVGDPDKLSLDMHKKQDEIKEEKEAMQDEVESSTR